MRDTQYFRQIPKYTIASKALTNHLLSTECTKENCITPLTEATVGNICTNQANITSGDCNKILETCNSHCLPITRKCSTETVEGVPCLAFYQEFNKYT